MQIFKKAYAIKSFLEGKKRELRKIGFVPTMGALHDGHLTLIEECKKHNEISVCSIFVNPTQFNDQKDFQKYPVTIEKDIQLLESAGCDVLFLPSTDEIYPTGFSNLEHYELGYLESILEGKFRPGHFQGVCQVVSRLLKIILPDQLFLGQKDFQQCMVIKLLIDLIDLSQVTQVVVCPTLREKDGLAMSSRNARLNNEERDKAVAVSASLKFIKDNLTSGPTRPIIEEAKNILHENDFRIDYIEITDAATLEPVIGWDGKQKIVALAAAFINEVRLIDNMPINP